MDYIKALAEWKAKKPVFKWTWEKGEGYRDLKQYQEAYINWEKSKPSK